MTRPLIKLHRRRLQVTAWLACAALAIGMLEMAAAQSLEVIELEHRTAEELLPALEPLLAPGGALSGQDYTLFVRTTPGNLAELRTIIGQLDRAPRQLLVSVRRAARAEIEREGIGLAGELATTGARARITGSDVQRGVERDAIAQVAVLEGNAALIDNGAEVPIVTAVAVGHGRRGWVGAQTEYRELPNGFAVMPRVNGDRVVLDIDQQSAELDGGYIQNSRVQTQITGRIGEWLALGEVSSSSARRDRGIAHRSYSTRDDAITLWVKVEIQ